MLGRISPGRLSGGLAAASLMSLVLLAGCTSDAQEASRADADTSGVTVLQPGEPGEPNTTVDPDVEVEAPQFTESDVAFMQMMIPHHAQAVEIAKLAEDQARDRRVRLMADRIRAGQGPEITMMAAWLEERNLDVPAVGDDTAEWDHSQHGHNGMHGMLSAEQLADLADAQGAAFDRLFLTSMVQHHEGAIRMAEDAGPQAGDVVVGETVSEVVAVQSAEISRMQDLLADLP